MSVYWTRPIPIASSVPIASSDRCIFIRTDVFSCCCKRYVFIDPDQYLSWYSLLQAIGVCRHRSTPLCCRSTPYGCKLQAIVVQWYRATHIAHFNRSAHVSAHCSCNLSTASINTFCAIQFVVKVIDEYVSQPSRISSVPVDTSCSVK